MLPMSDNYPSYKELFQELKAKRQEIKGIMHQHHIFGWPHEEKHDCLYPLLLG